MAGIVTLGLTIVAAGANAATICGSARNANGQPVPGVEVVVKDSSGKILGTAVTDQSGSYVIHGISGASGQLDLFLEPQTTGYRPGSGVLQLASVDPSSNVDWRVSNTSSAMAARTGECADPAGLSSGEVASIAVLGVGVAASGAGIGFGLTQGGDNQGNGENGKPISPSR
ncbi:MAG TPA: carboxypeptidase-like regulatory domain-containing protein [Candidatus Binataceae bacterium]|nr:carboxypeptidase-like regulatory domain-containing protein [Candidatus Binataceae bacterium]